MADAVNGPADPITYEDVYALATRLRGQTLETVTGKPFVVDVSSVERCVTFTPASSGLRQTDGRKAGERFVERYNQIGSLRPTDYADVTRNASYYVALLRARA